MEFHQITLIDLCGVDGFICLVGFHPTPRKGPQPLDPVSAE